MVKKTLIGIGAALAVVIVIFVIVVALKPSEFRVTRSAKMTAPPGAVFTQVNDYHNWEAWSPWAKLDPDAKTTFDGPTSGVGAKFSWAGNDKVGEGSQEIIESRPDELIRIKLDFTRPMQDTSTTEFVFKPAGDQTEVIWSMYGKANFIGKAMCMFMDMDKMVGGDFEKGLVSLKTIVEAAPESKQNGAGEPAPAAAAPEEPAPSTQKPAEN